jgi:dihydropteroate synthase
MDRRALALRIHGQPQDPYLMDADARRKRDAFLRLLRGRPAIMGILNLTPDSFFDGGRFEHLEAALAQARRLSAEGCDILDVGGESTRPGAKPVPEADEWRRLEAVLAALASDLPVPLSIDTSKAAIAQRAIDCGAVLVNDVWGLQKDPAMANTIAQAEAAVVIMHNRADKDETVDIIGDMRRFFDRSLALADRAGIPRALIILDPGIGFGKTSRQNCQALTRLGEFADLGLPVLVGTSRKGFLGSLGTKGAERTLSGTLAANLAAAAAGAAIFRVHDVAEHVAALAVFHTIRSAGRAPGLSSP